MKNNGAPGNGRIRLTSAHPFILTEFKVLQYLQKTKTLKMTFFLDQSFGIGQK